MAGLRLARAALDFRLTPVGTLRWVPYPSQCRAARPQCRPRHLLGTGVTVTVARLSDMRRSALSGYTRARLRSASALPIRSQLLRLGTRVPGPVSQGPLALAHAHARIVAAQPCAAQLFAGTRLGVLSVLGSHSEPQRSAES